ncbi:MAG: sodium:solute symporter family protein [Pirellulaceae bacterium]
MTCLSFDGLTTNLLLAQAEADLAAEVGGLGVTPYFVLGGYLLLLLVLGIYGWIKSQAGEEDYYLQGRGQGWIVSSLTIMATFFSSFALLGAPGMVYREGVVFALFSLNVPVAGLTVYLIGARISRAGRHFGFVTPGDMVAHYYGSRFSLRILVAITGFLYALPYVVMQIQAGGLISEELFQKTTYDIGVGETTFFQVTTFQIGAVILAAITMLYIMIGGMRSVAWTDMIQGALLIGGMLVAGLAMFLIFGGPAEFGKSVIDTLPDASQTAPGNTGRLWPTVLLTICLFGSSGSMVQPAQWMRYYSANSVKTLRRAALIFSAVLTTCFILGVMLIGLAGQVLYPLQFSISEPIKNAPSRLAGEMPEELARKVAYTDGALTVTWLGKDRPTITDSEARQLVALAADDPAFAAAVEKLQAKVDDPSQKPAVAPNPGVPAGFDSILIVVLHEQLPKALGAFGAVFASIMIIAIMAASMSTADSNLHALSAVLTRDVYDQFVRPKAGERERVWVGRAIIFLATVGALVIVLGAKGSKYDFLQMIAQMGLTAIAFSVQLLPLAIDMLFLRKGTGRGAAAGVACGLLGAFLFSGMFPFFLDMFGLADSMQWVTDDIGRIKDAVPMDGTAWGLLFNVPVFVLVSCFTRRVPEKRKAEYATVMRGGE